MEVDRSQATGGSLHISTEVVAKIARLAALEVTGVTGVVEENVQGILALGKNGLQRPVSVIMQDGIAEVSVNLYAAYGSVVQQVCAKVQDNIKTTIQNMTGITVSKVNITVVGLQQPVEK